MNDARVWYCKASGKQIGPISEDELIDLVRRGDVSHEDYVWKQGWPDWSKASMVQSLKSILEKQPPPLRDEPGRYGKPTIPARTRLKRIIGLLGTILFLAIVISAIRACGWYAVKNQAAQISSKSEDISENSTSDSGEEQEMANTVSAFNRTLPKKTGQHSELVKVELEANRVLVFKYRFTDKTINEQTLTSDLIENTRIVTISDKCRDGKLKFPGINATRDDYVDVTGVFAFSIPVTIDDCRNAQ